jgi:hypothetical protein
MPMRKLTLGVLCCLLLGAVMTATTPSTKNTGRTGKKGEITLVQPAKVGNRVLPPGTYIVQHRTSGEKHFVRFIGLKRDSIYYFWTRSQAGDFACRVEQAPQVAAETSFSTVNNDGAMRITEITIKGESAVYRF